MALYSLQVSKELNYSIDERTTLQVSLLMIQWDDNHCANVFCVETGFLLGRKKS